MLIEVAISSLADAVTAQANGADRLELNSALSLGGLTPSLAILTQIKKSISLPVMCMVRPRPAGFVYDAAEVQQMQSEIKLLLDQGADGIVVGALNPDRTIALSICDQLRNKIGGKTAIFHRAFDLTADPFESLETLIALGFDRILTSGQQPTAIQGQELIKQLITRADDRIEILPGAGLRADNLAEFLKEVPTTQIHGSFSKNQTDPASPIAPDTYPITDAIQLARARQIADEFEVY